MKLETPRLLLRPLTADDLAALAPILADPAVMRFSLAGPKSRLESSDFIDRCLAMYARYDFGLQAVVLRANQQLIGYCGLAVQRIDERREVEIGYRLAREHWGQGLATEAATAARDDARDRIGLTRLVAMIAPENVASCRVVEKLGMTLERNTTFRDIAIGLYALHWPSANR